MFDRRHSMDAHAREAAAAQAAMAEFYGTVWKPAAGTVVRCPLAWGGGSQEGTVIGPDGDRWLVQTDEGRLVFFLEELERI
jgi:streptogramin lyase